MSDDSSEAFITSIASEATREIVRASSRPMLAFLFPSLSRREAQSHADAMDITQERDLKRLISLNKHRRAEEIEEQRHKFNLSRQALKLSDKLIDGSIVQLNEHAKLLLDSSEESIEHRARELVERGLVRAFGDFEKKEMRIEYIEDRAIEYVENDDERDNSRPINEDWLEMFFRYASDVTESAVLETLAKGLANAAIKGRPMLSPRAIDMIRYFQPDSYDIFLRSAGIISLLDYIPLGFYGDLGDPKNDELEKLTELSLVKIETRAVYTLPIGNLVVNFKYKHAERFSFEVVRLTQIGREIAGLVVSDLRQASAALSMSGKPDLLRNLQVHNRLTADDIGLIAKALVRSMSDRWSIETTILKRTSSGNPKIFESHRDSVNQTFGIRPEKLDIDADTRLYFDAIQSQFNEFDEFELPILVENIDTNAQRAAD